MRQIVLDTETTGLDPKAGHRIIEIGCIELVNRRLTDRRWSTYLNPDRKIDAGASAVHGIIDEVLVDKPRFKDIVEDFIGFIRGGELIIHNAPFDLGFLNHELNLLGKKWGMIQDLCQVVDTLVLARSLHPGQKNNLDALCKRYRVDNSHRSLHGALLDAEILVEVYLAMTGGQVSLSLGGECAGQVGSNTTTPRRVLENRPRLLVPTPTPQEEDAHRGRLVVIDKASEGKCLWRQLDETVNT